MNRHERFRVARAVAEMYLGTETEKRTLTPTGW